MMAGIAALVFAFILFANDGGGAGVLLLILGGILLWIGIAQQPAARRTQPTALPGAGHPPVKPGNLSLSVHAAPTVIGEYSVTELAFHAKGVFSSNRRIHSPRFEVRIMDTMAQGSPILCCAEALQTEHSTEFLWQHDLPSPLEPGSGPTNWVKFGGVPKELLVFPVGGKRTIRFILSVSDRANRQLIVSAATDFVLNVEERGYLAMEADETEAQGAALQLGMCIAAADRRIDEDEVRVIKEWGEKQVKTLPDAEQAKRKNSLNKALQIATAEIRADRAGVLENEAIQVLNRINEQRFLYDAYELCLQVLKADGAAHPDEMAQLTRVAAKLKLDKDKIRFLADRHLANLTFAEMDGSDEDDKILGITSDMTVEQIRKHLNMLFRKYESRTAHDNPNVREQSKAWLERIAAARVRHLGSAAAKATSR